MGQIQKTIQVLVTAGISATAMALGVGCADTTPVQSGNSAIRNDVTDVRPMATPASYAPPVYDTTGIVPTAPQPITPQPITPEPVVASTPSSAASDAYSPMLSTTPSGKSAGKQTHTVRRGDTLFSIAKSAYGTGKAWKKIVSANPGVSPSKLKVGQVLVIPA